METTVAFEYNRGFWWFTCTMKLANGSTHFWSNQLTTEKAKEKAKELGIALPHGVQGANNSRVFRL